MSFWKKPKFILWTLVVILVAIVILQNVEPTSIRFLFWSFLAVSKLTLILISMLVGGIFALLLQWEFRSRKKDFRQKKDDGIASPPTLH